MTLPPNIWDAYWSEAKPGTEAALERVVAETQRTPTAFNWTDALSTVFPARLTMSQLLAIWEAMRDAAVYEPLGSKASSGPVADDGGWIKHDGRTQPIGSNVKVDALWNDGTVSRGADPSFLRWYQSPIYSCDITHWRPAK